MRGRRRPGVIGLHLSVGSAMLDQAELLEVIGELYDCAIEPSRWPQALGRMANSIGCSAASVTLVDPSQRDPAAIARIIAVHGTTPEQMRILEQSQAVNPLLSSGWFEPIDEPFCGIDYVGREAYFATRFYREFIAPMGFIDAALTILAKSPVRFGSLVVPHTHEQGEWTREQLDQVRLYAPHVRRAMTIADLLDTRALKDDMLSATLDLLTVGIVLVDGKGRIAHTNAAAERALDDCSCLRRDGDNLAARDPKSAAALSDAISVAAQGYASQLPGSGIAVPLKSGDGTDLAAWVLPLDGGLRIELAAPYAARVAVFIRELGAEGNPFPGELFVKRYGITPAECRVLMMLTQGMTPAEAADCLGISLPTTKTHLARLFEKNGTRGQPDLMRLAMSAIAPARVGER